MVAALGMLAPLVLLVATNGDGARPSGAVWVLTADCMICCVLSLLLIAQILRPMGRLAAALAELNGKLGFEDERAPADLEDLSAGLKRIAARFDTVSQRLLNQHPTTGLPTREPFLAGIGGDMARSDDPTVLTLIRFCDFDRMASFDRRGAEAALVAFSDRLKDAMRADLALAQVDRDCFAIWFGATPPEQASSEARAIAYVLEQDLGVGDQSIAPTLSLSAAIYPHDAQTPAALLACAVAALSGGEGQPAGALAFFSSDSSQEARRRYLMEQGLRQAAARDEFTLHFQPVIDVAQGRAVGAEALIRWRHAELGVVSPAEFVPVLEQSGLIEKVGLWVVHAACREARAWRQQGHAGLKIAVNLSTRQFRGGPGLAASIVRALERHRLTPDDLEIELTETAAMQDSTHTRQTLEQLHALGVGVAIDDFGAGYSSLSYLKNLPITRLKIDREFVSNIHLRSDSRAICAALIALARGLRIEVLAEGVEQRAEVEALVELGCTLFQGYYFAKPMTSSQFVATLADPSWLQTLSMASEPPRPRRRRA